MKPKFARLLQLIATALFITSLLPSREIQMIFSALLPRPPMDAFYAPPLAYSDKPVYMTHLGVILTATTWSMILILLAWPLAKKRKNELRDE